MKDSLDSLDNLGAYFSAQDEADPDSRKRILEDPEVGRVWRMTAELCFARLVSENPGRILALIMDAEKGWTLFGVVDPVNPDAETERSRIYLQAFTTCRKSNYLFVYDPGEAETSNWGLQGWIEMVFRATKERVSRSMLH